MSGAVKLPFEAKRVEQRGSGEWIWCVNGANGMLVISRTNETNAEFIVRACNAHGDLVEALQGVIRVADRATDEFDAARAALAKAGAA